MVASRAPAPHGPAPHRSTLGAGARTWSSGRRRSAGPPPPCPCRRLLTATSADIPHRVEQRPLDRGAPDARPILIRSVGASCARPIDHPGIGAQTARPTTRGTGDHAVPPSVVPSKNARPAIAAPPTPSPLRMSGCESPARGCAAPPRSRRHDAGTYRPADVCRNRPRLPVPRRSSRPLPGRTGTGRDQLIGPLADRGSQRADRSSQPGSPTESDLRTAPGTNARTIGSFDPSPDLLLGSGRAGAGGTRARGGGPRRRGRVRSTRSSASTTTRQPGSLEGDEVGGRDLAGEHGAELPALDAEAEPDQPTGRRTPSCRGPAWAAWPGASAAAAPTRPGTGGPRVHLGGQGAQLADPAVARQPRQLGEQLGVGERAAGEQRVHRAQRQVRRQQPAEVQGGPQRRGQPQRPDPLDVAPGELRPLPSARDGPPAEPGPRPASARPAPAGSRPPRAPTRPSGRRRRLRPVARATAAARRPVESGAAVAAYTPRSSRRTMPSRSIRSSDRRSIPDGSRHRRGERAVEREQGVQRVQRQRLVHPRQGEPGAPTRRTAIHRPHQVGRRAELPTTTAGGTASAEPGAGSTGRSAPGRSGGAISGTSSSTSREAIGSTFST